MRLRRAAAVVADTFAVAPARHGARLRLLWLAGTLGGTVVPLVLAPLVAPSAAADPARALGWLLFVGSSVHVGASAWFYSVPEVRRHMASHRRRYVWVPVALIAIGAALAVALPMRAMSVVLVGFFAWQFHHFQKQNLGVAALAARTCGARGPGTVERRALIAAGAGGILALVGHPSLLQVGHVTQLDWVFRAGACIVAAAGVVGLVPLVRRRPADRPAPYAAAYVIALLFFLPPLLFTSPYAAVAGLTIAHGLQYLLLVGLVSAIPSDGRSAALGLAVLTCIALVAGLVLNRLSHLHGTGGIGSALFGAYLGLSTAHFVIDAELWRLRDEFPRAFLSRRVPYLLVPG
jgi:hypothetical protein